MKKRLLITSIVMMLVVAVALSTATYAWFTSNASVTASSISMTAATNQASSIGISWTDGSYGTSISATGPTAQTKFDPMAPSALSAGVTTITSATAAGGVDFWSGNIKQEGGTNYFNATGIKHWGADGSASQVVPYVWTNGTQTSFFLKNLSDTRNITSVTVRATVDGKGADLIRIAVFARIGSTANTAPEGAYTLKKVLSNATFTYTVADAFAEGAVYYSDEAGTLATGITSANFATSGTLYTRVASAAASGTAYCTNSTGITAGTVASNISSNTTDNAITVDLGALNANCIAELIVYVWTDGTALVDNRGGEAASIKLDIAA